MKGMKRKKSKMDTLVKVIIGALLIAWLVLLMAIPTKAPVELTIPEMHDPAYDSLEIELEYAKAEKDKLTDSLFGAQVENGRLEIELNKSNAEVGRLINQTRKAQVIRDTPKIVQNCDSLIAELEQRKLPVDSEYVLQQQVINDFRTKIANRLDSMYSTERNYRVRLQADVSKAYQINQSLQNDFKKARKHTAWMVAGGFVAGLLTTIFITK